MGAGEAGREKLEDSRGPQWHTVLSFWIDCPPNSTAPSIFQYQEVPCSVLQNLRAICKALLWNHPHQGIFAKGFSLPTPMTAWGASRQAGPLRPGVPPRGRVQHSHQRLRIILAFFTYKMNMGISITYLQPKDLWGIIIEHLSEYLIWILPKEELIALQWPFLYVYVLGQALSCERKFWLKHFF